MLGNYFGTNLKTSGLFTGCVAGTAVIVTLAFWLIFGFDTWKQDVRTASDLMTAAVVAPVAQMPPTANVAGQFFCPQHGAIGLPAYDAAGTPHCPICGQVMGFNSIGYGGPVLAAAGAG